MSSLYIPLLNGLAVNEKKYPEFLLSLLLYHGNNKESMTYKIAWHFYYSLL